MVSPVYGFSRLSQNKNIGGQYEVVMCFETYHEDFSRIYVNSQFCDYHWDYRSEQYRHCRGMSMNTEVFKECVSDIIYSGSNQRAHVIFGVGSEQFGIAVEFVKKIVKKNELNPVTDVEPGLVGTLQYDGCEIPVMDIRNLLNLPGSDKGRSIVIIIEQEERLYGLMVDFIYVVPGFITSGIDTVLN